MRHHLITAADILDSFRLRPPVHQAYNRACWQCFAPWQIAARIPWSSLGLMKDVSMGRLIIIQSVSGVFVLPLVLFILLIQQGWYTLSLAAWGMASCALGLWLIIRSFRYRASWPCFLALGSWGPFCYAVFGSLPVFLIVTGLGHFTWPMMLLMACLLTLNFITGFKVMDDIAKARYKLLFKEAYAYAKAKEKITKQINPRAF